MADPALSASSRTVMTWPLPEGRRTELSASLPFSRSGRQRREERGWSNSAQTGAESAAAGSAPAETGSNWLELAGLGSARNQAPAEKLIPISDLLEKPIVASETSRLAAREHPAQLNGVSAAALASGQNCPPPA